MTLKRQLTACLKQTAQMEQEAQSLRLAPSEQVRLAALLRSAKLQLWERKLLDLSLRNNLLNMKLVKESGVNALFLTLGTLQWNEKREMTTNA